MLLNNIRFSFFSQSRQLAYPSKIIRKRVEKPVVFYSKQWVSKA